MPKPSTDFQPIAISVPSAARMLSISARTVWLLVKNHEIQSFRVGSRVLIPYAALTNYVNQRLAAEREA